MESLSFTSDNFGVFLLAFIPAIINLGLAAYIFFNMPHRLLNNLFTLLLITSAGWQLSNSIMRISANLPTALFWDNILSQVGFFSSPFLLHFAAVYTNKIKHPAIKYSIILTYFIVFIYTTLYAWVNNNNTYVLDETWGWLNARNNTTYSISLGIFLQLQMIAASIILVDEFVKTKKGTNKSRGLLLIIGAISFVILQVFLTEIIIPLSTATIPIPITPTTMAIFSIVAFIALKKYNFIKGDDSISKDEILKAVSDIVIVVNEKLEISFVNDAGLQATCYTFDQLQENKITGIIQSGVLEDLLKKGKIKNLECKMVDCNGETTPILLSADKIQSLNKTHGHLLLCRNIKDIVSAREELQKNERRFRKLIEKSKDGIAIVDGNGIVLYASPSIENVVGYTTAEVVGKNFMTFMHPDDFAAAAQVFAENISANSAKETIIKAVHKNGREVWLESIGLNYFDDPDLNGLVTVFRDITEKYKIQQEQQKSLALFKALIENMKHGVLITDENDNIFSLNKEYCQIMDLKAPTKDLIGTCSHDLLEKSKKHIKNPEEFTERVKNLSKNRKLVLAERIDFADGRIFERDFIPIYTSEGDYKGSLRQYRDITEKITSREQLKEKNNLLEMTLEIGQMGSWTADLETYDAWWSREALDIYGLTENTFNNKADTFFEFVHPEDLERIRKVSDIAVSEMKPFSMEHRIILKNGEVKWVYSRSIVESFNGKPKRLIGVVQDITERKNIEVEFIKKNAELTKANEELDKFVYSASHDIRSPLMSILGIIEIACTEISDAGTHLYLNMIKDNVLKLDDFTLKIIHFARNEKTEPKPEAFKLTELLNEVVDNLKYQVMARNIDFNVNVDENITAVTDRARLYIVLSNLVSNAIKYRKEDENKHSIELGAELENDILKIKVKDTGEGIPHDKIDKIFDMFTRFSVQSKGSGLGLFIVKEIMEKLKGDISVESEEGEGTSFAIQLPNLQIEEVF